MVMSFALKILTLNCWGLPGPYPIGSKHRNERIIAIAKALRNGNYDIVSLQELWRQQDYEYLRKELSDSLPFCFYFYSGYLGSGVAIFSKHEIVDTLMHRYSLNGYPHHIHRGDWFGGKVVGLTKLNYKGSDLFIHVYATHIHAEYDKANDLYLPHRTLQAYEMSQFVRATSSDADVLLVMGDMNFESSDLGHKMILANADLSDAWSDRQNKELPADSNKYGNTCEIPSNCYCSKESLIDWPEGKRIDYILYGSQPSERSFRSGFFFLRCMKDIRVVVNECYTTLSRIPETDINYSDHEAVYAEFSIEILAESRVKKKQLADKLNRRRAVLNDSLVEISKGIVKVSRDFWFYVVALLVLGSTYIYTIDVEVQHPNLILMILPTRFLLTLLLGFCGWYAFMALTTEEKALLAAKNGIEVILRSIDTSLSLETACQSD